MKASIKAASFLNEIARTKGGGFAGSVSPDGLTVLSSPVLDNESVVALAGSELAKLGSLGADTLAKSANTHIDTRFRDDADRG